MKRKSIGLRIIAAILCCLTLTGTLAGCKDKQTASPINSNTAAPNKNEEDSITSLKYQKSIDKYVAALKKRMAEDGVPGASLSITENGKIVYSKGFGYANVEKKVPVDTDTLFHIGSVGKMYCTAAMLKLAQDKKISLDDPVTRYLPKFKMDDPRYKDITVRMLLNHSAGLPTDISMDVASLNAGHPQPEIADIYEPLRSQHLRSNPGEYAVYSNLGFGIAGKIIEEVTKQSFGAYLKENFFDPLGLKNTYMANSMNESIPANRFALPVDEQGRTLPREFSGGVMVAEGGIVASTEDTSKFISSILSPQSGLLNKEMISELRRDQSLTSKIPGQQVLNGLGWDMQSRIIPETPVYQKTGGSTHCATDTVTAPDAGITISVSFQQTLNEFVYCETTYLMRDILTDIGVITEKTNMPVYPTETAVAKDNSTFSGIYNGGDGLHDLDSIYKVEIATNVMKYSVWNYGEWQPLGEYTRREDGSYGAYEENGNLYSRVYEKKGKIFTAYSFKTIGDDVYLMKRELTPNYDITTAIAKHLPERASSAVWAKRAETTWLRTSMRPNDYQAIPFMLIAPFQDLPGYISVFGGTPLMEIKDDMRLATTTNQVSGSGYADLTFKNGVLSWIAMDFVPAETVAKALPTVNTKVSFEKAGVIKWFYVAKDMQISVDAPFEKVRVLTVGPELESFYDNIVDSGPFVAKAGSYIGLTSNAPGEIDMGISPVQ